MKRQHKAADDGKAYLVLHFDADLVHGAVAVLGKILVSDFYFSTFLFCFW